MVIKEYKKRRKFENTPEPKTSKSNLKEDIFVIQKHSARRLHYDLRLKIGRVLKSWAVPHGLPKDRRERRLAIETEDHPLSYYNFEGIIPKGNYGAGEVKIYDKGKFYNIRRLNLKESYKDGKIEIVFDGKKIKGAFAIIKTKVMESKRTNWVILRMNEEKLFAKLRMPNKRTK